MISNGISDYMRGRARRDQEVADHLNDVGIDGADFGEPFFVRHDPCETTVVVGEAKAMMPADDPKWYPCVGPSMELRSAREAFTHAQACVRVAEAWMDEAGEPWT